MAKIKLQVVVGSNRGTESADFRGPLFIGDAQGDHHSTVYTYKTEDPVAIAEALVGALTVNAFFAKFFGNSPIFPRVGVFDDN